MDGRNDAPAEFERIERKLDRLTRLVVLLLVCQPVLLIGLLMPSLATQSIVYALLALLALLAVFPNLETQLPAAMRRCGRLFGRVSRWLRAAAPG